MNLRTELNELPFKIKIGKSHGKPPFAIDIVSPKGVKCIYCKPLQFFQKGDVPIVEFDRKVWLMKVPRVFKYLGEYYVSPSGRTACELTDCKRLTATMSKRMVDPEARKLADLIKSDPDWGVVEL